MNFEGMTLNERLYHSNLMEAFDEALVKKNVEKLRRILLEVKLTNSQVDETIRNLKILNDGEEEPQDGHHDGWPPREDEINLSELERLYDSAFTLQEKASESLWIMLKDGTGDPVKVRNFENANEAFHLAYDKLVDTLQKAGEEYSIVLTGAVLEIDKPFIGFRGGLAIASTRTGTRIHRDLNDL